MLRPSQAPVDKSNGSPIARQHAAGNGPWDSGDSSNAIWYLYSHYCSSGTPSTHTRVSTPNSTPKMTLSQFMRMCQDAGIAAPRGPMEPSLLQVIHNSYKPLGATALTYPHFLQAMEAVARSIQRPPEDIQQVLSDLATKRLSEFGNFSSPARPSQSAEDRQRRSPGIYSHTKAGASGSPARSTASSHTAAQHGDSSGRASEQHGGQGHQRFAHVNRMWRPSMVAVEEQKSTVTTGATQRHSAPSGPALAAAAVPSNPAGSIQEAWSEQGLGGFVSLGRPGSAVPTPPLQHGRADLSSADSNSTVAMRESDMGAGSSMQSMPMWAIKLFDRVKQLERQALEAGTLPSTQQEQQQQQRQQQGVQLPQLQSWGSRKSNSSQLILDDVDSQDLSLAAAAERSEAKGHTGSVRPPLPPVRVKSADRHSNMGATLDLEQRLAALEAAAATTSASLLHLQQQVQEQAQHLAEAVQGMAGNAGPLPDVALQAAKVSELQQSMQALAASVAEQKTWQAQQQHLTASVAALSAAVAQRRTSTAQASEGPSHLTISLTREAAASVSSPPSSAAQQRIASEASWPMSSPCDEALANLVGDMHVLNQRVTAVEGVSAVAAAQATANAASGRNSSAPSSPSASTAGTAVASAATCQVPLDASDGSDVGARLLVVERELAAVQQQQQQASHDAMAVAAASSAAATATATASNAAHEASRLEQLVKALEGQLAAVVTRPESESTHAAGLQVGSAEGDSVQTVSRLMADVEQLRNQVQQLTRQSSSEQLPTLQLQLHELTTRVETLELSTSSSAAAGSPQPVARASPGAGQLGEGDAGRGDGAEPALATQLQQLAAIVEELRQRPYATADDMKQIEARLASVADTAERAAASAAAAAATAPMSAGVSGQPVGSRADAASAEQALQLQQLTALVEELRQRPYALIEEVRQVESKLASLVERTESSAATPVSSRQEGSDQGRGAGSTAELEAQLQRVAAAVQELQQRPFALIDDVRQVQAALTSVAEKADRAAMPAASGATASLTATAAASSDTDGQQQQQQQLYAALEERVKEIATSLQAMAQQQQQGSGMADVHMAMQDFAERLDMLHNQQRALAAAADLPKLEQQVEQLASRVQQELIAAAQQRQRLSDQISQYQLSRQPSQATMGAEPSDGSLLHEQPSEGSMLSQQQSSRAFAPPALEQRFEELVAQVKVLERQQAVTAQFEQGMGDLADRMVTMEEQQLKMQLKKVEEVEQQVQGLAREVDALREQQKQQQQQQQQPEALSVARSVGAAPADPSATAPTPADAAVASQLQQLSAKVQGLEGLQADMQALGGSVDTRLSQVSSSVQGVASAMQAVQQGHVLLEQRLNQAEAHAKAHDTDALAKELSALQHAYQQTDGRVEELQREQTRLAEAQAAAASTAHRPQEDALVEARAPAEEAAGGGEAAEALLLVQALQRKHQEQEEALAQKLHQVREALLLELQQLSKHQEQTMLLEQQVKQSQDLTAQMQPQVLDLTSKYEELSRLVQQLQGSQATRDSNQSPAAPAQPDAIQGLQGDVGVIMQQLQSQMDMQQTLLAMVQQQQLQLQALEAATAAADPLAAPAAAKAAPAAGGSADAGAGALPAVDELRSKMKAFQSSQKSAVKMLVVEFQKLQEQVKEAKEMAVAAAAGAGGGAAGVAQQPAQDLGVVSLMDRLAALEERVQAGKVEQGAGASAELARALGVLSIETQKSLAWLKEELQDVRDVASRAASAAPSRIMSRANSVGPSRNHSRRSSMGSVDGGEGGESHRAGGDHSQHDTQSRIVEGRAGAPLRSFSERHKDLPQGPSLAAEATESRIADSGRGGVDEESGKEELKRAMALLSLETRRELAELKEQVQGMASRAPSAGPSRPYSAASNWGNAEDEEDLMAGPTPALTPHGGTMTTPLPLSGPAGQLGAMGQQVVAAAAQLQAMQVKELNERLHQMEATLPSTGTLGELVTKVEDMAQALMMVADKLNKRLVKMEKVLGKGSVSGGIVSAIEALQEQAAAAETELRGYLDVAATSMEQRVDAMYMSLGLMPPAPGPRPWQQAPARMYRAREPEDAPAAARADLTAVPARTSMRTPTRAKRGSADGDGPEALTTEASASPTVAGRGGRRVVINHEASEVHTIPLVRKGGSQRQLPPAEDPWQEQWEDEEAQQFAPPPPPAPAPAPAPVAQHAVRGPLTSLVPAPAAAQPPPPMAQQAQVLQQMQQMQLQQAQMQQAYMQAVAAMQQQQQQQQQLGLLPSVPSVASMAPLQQLWGMPSAPMAPMGTDPMSPMGVMLQLPQPIQERLSFSGTRQSPAATPMPAPTAAYAPDGGAMGGADTRMLPAERMLVSQSSKAEWDELTAQMTQQMLAGAVAQQTISGSAPQQALGGSGSQLHHSASTSQLPATVQQLPSNTVAKRPSLKQRQLSSSVLRVSASGAESRPGSVSPSPPGTVLQMQAGQSLQHQASLGNSPATFGQQGSNLGRGTPRALRFVAEGDPNAGARFSGSGLNPESSGVTKIKLPHQPDRTLSIQMRRPGDSDMGQSKEETAVLSRAQSQTLEHDGKEMEFDVAEESYF